MRPSLFLPLLLLAACLPLVPGLFGPFQHDDLSNLPRLIVGPFNWEALLDVAVRNDSGPLKRPLSNILLGANYWLHGINHVLGFKLGNLIIHFLGGLAAYWLLLEVFRRILRHGDLPWPPEHLALLGALLWIIHPLQVSTALYVVQRMAQIATLFSFVAVAWMLRQLRLADGDRVSLRHSIWISVGFLTATLLAMAGKENGALTPVLAGASLLALTTKPRQTIAETLAALRAFRLPLYVCVVAPILLGLAVLAVRPDLMLAGYATRPWSLDERLLTQAVVIWKYLGLIVLPRPDAMGLYHEVPTYRAEDVGAWLATAGLLALALSAMWLRQRFPLAAWAILWFLASHLLESTVLPLEMIYEHRNYTGLLGLAALAAWLLALAARRMAVAPALLATLLILSLGGLTLSRSVDWSSQERFYAAEYRNHPHSFRALLGLYAILRENNVYPDVVAHLEGQIIQRRRHHPWVALMQAAKECDDPAYRADWNAVETRIRNSRRLGRLSDYARFVLDRVMRGSCPSINLPAFSSVLELAYAKSRHAGDGHNSELFAMLIAWRHRHEKDWPSARIWYANAAAARRSAFEPLLQLAYLELNLSEAQRAREALDMADERRLRYKLPIGYRIREAREFLEDLAPVGTTPKHSR